MVDGRLVIMEETKSSFADDRTKEDHADDTNLIVIIDDKNEEQFYLYSRLRWASLRMCFVIFLSSSRMRGIMIRP